MMNKLGKCKCKCKCSVDNTCFSVKGNLKVTVRDAQSGEILDTQQFSNLTVTAGKELIAKLLNGESVAVPNFCAVGTGSTAIAAGDTTLEGEIGRLEVTYRSRSGAAITYSTFFGSGDCNGTWANTALFNADSGGSLLCAALFSSAISKDSAKTVTVDWTVTIT